MEFNISDSRTIWVAEGINLLHSTTIPLRLSVCAEDPLWDARKTRPFDFFWTISVDYLTSFGLKSK